MTTQREKMAELLGEAFDKGYYGSFDLRNQVVEEILQKLQSAEDGKEEYRIWSVEELKSMPEGTIFSHLTNGRCWVVNRSNGTKRMQFEKGQTIDFINDTYPWDRPMKLVHRGG